MMQYHRVSNSVILESDRSGKMKQDERQLLLPWQNNTVCRELGADVNPKYNNWFQVCSWDPLRLQKPSQGIATRSNSLNNAEPRVAFLTLILSQEYKGACPMGHGNNIRIANSMQVALKKNSSVSIFNEVVLVPYYSQKQNFLGGGGQQISFRNTNWF